MANSKSKDAQNSQPEEQKSNTNPSKVVANDQQKDQNTKAQEESAKDSKSSQESAEGHKPTAAEEEARATLEADLTRQGQSGNPYLHSSNGQGRPYNPEIDGAPGKEAEKKQQENDNPKA